MCKDPQSLGEYMLNHLCSGEIFGDLKYGRGWILERRSFVCPITATSSSFSERTNVEVKGTESLVSVSVVKPSLFPHTFTVISINDVGSSSSMDSLSASEGCKCLFRGGACCPQGQEHP